MGGFSLVLGLALLQAAWGQPAPARGPAGRFTNGRPDTVVLLGGTRHTLATTNQWTTFGDAFDADTAGYRHILQIWNGFDGTGYSHPISSGTVTLDGNPILGSTDLNSASTYLSRVLWPDPSNYLNSSLYGPAGSYIDLDILRVPDPTWEFFNAGTFVRPASGPLTSTQYFTTPNYGPYPRTIHIVNGTPGTTSDRVTSGTVKVNGVVIFDQNSWGVGVASRDRQVTLFDTPGLQNQLYVRIDNPPGSKFTISFSATDTTAGTINLTQPAEGLVTAASKLAFSGNTVDETFGTLTVPATGHIFSTPGAFVDSVSLAAPEGPQTFTISMTNRAGYSASLSRTVVHDTQPPVLNLSAPTQSSFDLDSDSCLFSGSWRDVSRTVVTIDGDTVSAADTSGIFNFKVALDVGPNRVLVRARDGVGHETSLWRFINRVPPGEQTIDSTVVAPATTEAGISGFFDNVRFLLDQSQSGVLQGAIQPERAAVVRGQVSSRDFGPLPNVVVRVLGQEDTLGQTLTRADGRFDLLVNGGRPLTLRFTKLGYLESQRTVDVPANDFVTLDDVALIGRSSRATHVDLASDSSVVKSRFESDQNGDRRLTMLFRQGSKASVIRAPGDTVALANFVTVRSKEYTVGADGLETMPAVLPASTAYTYCLDMSLDEAESLGALGSPAPPVQFSKPIACYVKDFLHLPIGSSIPAGYYDPRSAKWIAGKDGCVIRIAGITNGLADVDADSLVGPDTEGHLDSLGFDPAERQRLAAQYSVGDTLWRVQVDHFSIWDFNLNLAWLAYADSPAAARARRLLGLTKCRVKRPGSIIDCENRVLGEEIPVVGTPYTLNYQSYRVPGDAAMRRLRVPVSGATLPAEVDRMLVVVDVAGQRIIDPGIMNVLDSGREGSYATARKLGSVGSPTPESMEAAA